MDFEPVKGSEYPFLETLDLYSATWLCVQESWILEVVDMGFHCFLASGWMGRWEISGSGLMINQIYRLRDFQGWISLHHSLLQQGDHAWRSSQGCHYCFLVVVPMVPSNTRWFLYLLKLQLKYSTISWFFQIISNLHNHVVKMRNHNL